MTKNIPAGGMIMFHPRGKNYLNANGNPKMGTRKKTGREMSPEMMKTPPVPGYLLFYARRNSCNRYLLLLLNFYAYCCTYVLKINTWEYEQISLGDDSVSSP